MLSNNTPTKVRLPKLESITIRLHFHWTAMRRRVGIDEPSRFHLDYKESELFEAEVVMLLTTCFCYEVMHSLQNLK